MKQLIIIVSLSLLSFISINDQDKMLDSQSNYTPSIKLHCPDHLSITQYINENIKNTNDLNGDWYSEALENIKLEEYNITYSEKDKVFQSPNRKNNIRFIYHKEGFTAMTRSLDLPQSHEDTKEIDTDKKKGKKPDEWEITFGVEGFSKSLEFRKEHAVMTNILGEINAAGNKAFIEDENIRINYKNNEEGMRQDFIIKKRPEGNGKLRLNITADTKLKMIVGADALMFKDKNGIEKMKYSALKVWDANGKELRAYFEKQLQFSNGKYQIGNAEVLKPDYKSKFKNSFSIVVNDAEADYPITIDPLSFSPDWTAEGDQSNAHFGCCVSSAGDVNGDGYSDVIIGASGFDNGQSNEGRAFVYFGSSLGLSTLADWTAESNQSNSYFGSSVAMAGDVNNDGFDDVIVGAYLYENGHTAEGRTYVYHGSDSGLSGVADWIKECDQAFAYFGYSVSTAGDVNDDGYSDVIIGAYGYDRGQSDEGRVFVYHGSSSGLSNVADWTAQSDQVAASFGWSVSSAGDINNDGYSDVIVGSPYFDNFQISEGRAFVYYGSDTGLSLTVNWTAESNQESAAFGNCVSGAGDVNGDGYDDVVIGSYFYDNGQINEGKVFVYHGAASGLSLTADWAAESDQATANFGWSVSDAGDVNSDGYSDIIIGALYFDSGQSNEGRVFLYTGSQEGLSSAADWTSESNETNTYFGSGVSSAGDVNGDGIDDVIIGATGYSNIQSNEGRAYVYYGKSSIKHLGLTVIIEGFYDYVSDDMTGDTVTVYLRNYFSPYINKDSAKAFVDSSGQGMFSLSNALNGINYFIHLKHRNSIETWSAFTVSYNSVNNLDFDFTNSSSKAFGNNQIQVDTSPVRFAIYSGDVNQDGSIDISDYSIIDNDAFNLVTGYVPTDLNGDGIVDIADQVIADNNGFSFINKITP